MIGDAIFLLFYDEPRKSDTVPETIVNFNQTVYFSIERDFREKTWFPVLRAYFPVASYIFVFYFVGVFLLKKYMKNKPPFKLTLLLVLWNCIVSAFSIFLSSRIIPERLYVFSYHGLEYSVCHLEYYTGPAAFWSTCVFVLSKVFLLGDTVFLILKKKELTALHLWHHISTMVYTWYMTSNEQVLGRWLIMTGIVPHCYLYGYYAVRTAWKTVPKFVPISVVIVLLCEEAVGFTLLSYTLSLKLRGRPCDTSYFHIMVSFGIYISYFILHSNFLFKKFLKKNDTMSKKKI